MRPSALTCLLDVRKRIRLVIATEAEQPEARANSRPTRRGWRHILAVGVGRLNLLAIVATVLALVFAYLWPTDLSQTGTAHVFLAFVAFMVRTFEFHLGLALLAGMLLALALKRYRSVIVCLPFLIATLGPPVWSQFGAKERKDAGGLRVLSSNLLYANTDMQPFLDEVRESNPDVILIQEYTPEHAASLRPRLAVLYPYRVEAFHRSAFGEAIYSKRAFIGEPVEYPQPVRPDGSRDTGVINLNDPQLRVVIEHAGREVVVQNIHTVPPTTFDASLVLFREQRWMIGWIRDWARAEQRPIVMAGDFNCTPSSPHAAELREAGLIDVHAAVGSGRGATWPAKGRFAALPGIRIDQAFVKGLDPVSIRVGRYVGSDHRPIIFDVK